MSTKTRVKVPHASPEQVKRPPSVGQVMTSPFAISGNEHDDILGPAVEVIAPPQPVEELVPLQTGGQAVSQPQQKESKSQFPSRAVAIGLCILVIIAAVVGLIVFLFVYNRKPTKEDEDADEDNAKPAAPKPKAPTEDDLAKLHNELETYRKNDTLFKMRINDYETKLRAMSAENEKLRKAADPEEVARSFRASKGIPTENDFVDGPDKPREPEQRPANPDQPPTDEVKYKQWLKNKVNQPRETVESIFQQEKNIKESSQQQVEEDTRKMLDEENKSKIIIVNDTNDEDADDDIASAIASSGSLKK